MRPRREIAAVAAFASAAAALTALSDYALGILGAAGAVSLRMATAFLVAVLLLSAWRRLTGAIDKHASSPETGSEQMAAPRAEAPKDTALPPAVMTRLGEEISACNPIIHTLCDHVQTVVTNTEDVAMNIAKELKNVDDTITGLLTFLRVSSRDKILPIVEQTEIRLHANNQLLAAFLATRVVSIETTHSQFACISDLVHRLDAIVQSIRRLARQTNMLALNANVEAARAGSAGKGFAVVASEVKALSRQTDQAAKDIGEGLQALKDAIAESQGVLQVRLGREREDLSAVVSSIGELEQNMRVLIDQQRATVNEMIREGEKIAELVIELNGSIQFQDIVRQRLNGVTGVLHQIVDHAESLTNVVDMESLDSGDIEGAFASIRIRRQQALECSTISHVATTDAGFLELF
jgi:methyl-accepting chemotaxis protein